MTSVDRLLQFIDKQGISKRAFYLSVGVSNGYLDKTKSVNSDVMKEIIYNYPDLNMNWLITGEGEMLKSEQKPAVTPAVNHGQHDTNDMVLSNTPAATGGGKTKKGHKSDPATDPPTRILTPQFITVDSYGNENILHVSIKAAAGYLKGHADPEYLERLPSFRLPGLNNATYRSFEVDGDSMYPTLKHGQMVIGEWVEKLEDIRDDRVHILVLKNSAPIIKRVLNRISNRGLLIAKSDATNDRELYKNIEIHPEEVLEVWYARFHGGFDFQSPTDMWKRVNNHEADITILRSTVDKLTEVIKTAGLLK